MLVLRHWEREGRRLAAPVIAFGRFDGMHRGHQEVVRRLVNAARGRSGDAVLLMLLSSSAAEERAAPPIEGWRTRVERAAEYGVHAVILQRPTAAFVSMSPREFVRRCLADGLGVRHIVIGECARFGPPVAGDADALRRLSAELGIGIDVVGTVTAGGAALTGERIRRAICDGQLGHARALLGRPPAVRGRVVHGRHRGRALGFPTANLSVDGVVLPPDGVYAVWVRTEAGGLWRGGVANLGFNPTFGDCRRSLETHLFDFGEDLYGRRIEVGFAKRLRGETKFPSVAALAEQIARDATAARQALEAPCESP